MTLPLPRPVVDSALQISSTQGFGPQFGVHNVVEWGPKTSAYSLAKGNVLTPTILLPDYTSQPAYDLAAKTVRWTLAATG